MKAVLPCLLLCFALFSASTARAQELKFANLGDLKLESGEILHDCRIGYRTFGHLNADASNAILFPTWFGGISEELKSNIGPKGLIDDADYFIIGVDALSNGVSTSPSNSAAQPRMKFPKITIRDMVNSEHQLVTTTLGLKRLKAVMGASMGGMQTFQWIVSYPDFMDKAVPIVGSPRLAPFDLLLWQTEIDEIMTNPLWDNGNYRDNPERLVEFEMGELFLNTPQQYNRTHTRQQVFDSLAKYAVPRNQDSNDKIRQAQAMMALDVSAPFGGSLEQAAAAVKAKVFVIVAAKDHMVTPQPACDFAALLHAQILELDSDCGHLATVCETPKVHTAIADFLRN